MGVGDILGSVFAMNARKYVVLAQKDAAALIKDISKNVQTEDAKQSYLERIDTQLEYIDGCHKREQAGQSLPPQVKAWCVDKYAELYNKLLDHKQRFIKICSGELPLVPEMRAVNEIQSRTAERGGALETASAEASREAVAPEQAPLPKNVSRLILALQIAMISFGALQLLPIFGSFFWAVGMVLAALFAIASFVTTAYFCLPRNFSDRRMILLMFCAALALCILVVGIIMLTQSLGSEGGMIGDGDALGDSERIIREVVAFIRL